MDLRVGWIRLSNWTVCKQMNSLPALLTRDGLSSCSGRVVRASRGARVVCQDDGAFLAGLSACDDHGWP
jgi:hypothetical protein